MSKHKTPTPIDEVWKKLPADRAFYRTWAAVRDQLHNAFSNSTPLVEIGGKHFSIPDATAAGVVSRSGMYFIGSRGSGKSLLTDAIRLSLFGDEGLFMTGDPNLNVKALYERLDLTGKTTDEIYKLAKSISFPLVCVDELTNMPGIVQRSLLGIGDGYIEIRGKKIYLGNAVPEIAGSVGGNAVHQSNKYVLFVANGNPVANGDYSVFLEDLAMLDRISLIIDFDRVPPADGNLARIGEQAMDKEELQRGSLSQVIIPAYGYLRQSLKPDVRSAIEEVTRQGLTGTDRLLGVGQAFTEVAMRSMLMEAIYAMFRYVSIDVGGGKSFTCDKVSEKRWRDLLLEKGKTPGDTTSPSGVHESGTSIAFCSEISPRTLSNTGRLALALFKVAQIENQLRQMKSSSTPKLHPVTLFIDSYLAALKMALTYDRRFIPPEFAEDQNLIQKTLLDNAFNELRARIIPQTRSGGGSFAVDIDGMDLVTTLYSNFLAARALGDADMVHQIFNAAKRLPGSTLLNKTVFRVMAARVNQDETKLDNDELALLADNS